MTTKVYTWLPLPKHQEVMGHSSLELSNGTYISWRSSLFQMAEDKDTLLYGSYVDDVNLEGRQPDHTCILETLDDDTIQKWWNSWQTQETWRNQGKLTPSFTVLEAIMIGLGWSRTEDPYNLSPKELIKKINQLGIVDKNIKSNRKCIIL